MAASVIYSTFGGRVIAENRGGVIRQYVPDNLGSTVALIDVNGTVTDTYDYWPYGEERVHTGPSTTSLTFLGTLGYFKDFTNVLYVRARHLRVDLTRWMTVDPLWPRELTYSYVSDAPVMYPDPSGLGLLDLIGKCVGSGIGVIAEILGDLSAGKGIPSNLLCKLGGACVGALIAAGITALILWLCPECGLIAACVGGALGSVASTLLAAFCSDHVPCQPASPTTPCTIGAAAIKAALQCIGGMMNFGLGNSLGSALTRFVGGLLAGMGCANSGGD